MQVRMDLLTGRPVLNQVAQAKWARPSGATRRPSAPAKPTAMAAPPAEEQDDMRAKDRLLCKREE
jgi:hypothetical protein